MSIERATNRWLVRPRPLADARLRLLCVPFAGGGAMQYRSWPDALPPRIEVWAVQLPGRETRFREDPYSRAGPLIAALADAFEEELLAPYALFGHSLGALLAFEFAREQRRRGRAEPSHLFVSGRIAPQLIPRRAPWHDLPEAEFRKELAQLDGTPRAVLEHDELMRLFIPTLRADLAANETHEHRQERPLDCPITALGGFDDPWVNRDELEAWRIHTSSSFTLHQFPGKHFFVQTAQSQVLSIVEQALAGDEGEP